MPSIPSIICGANDRYPELARVSVITTIRSPILHRIASDSLACSPKSRSPRPVWPSASSMDRCATTRKACSTAMLAITIAGRATSPPLNAITRIAAASTSQGSASRKRNGPNETCGSGCRSCRRSAIVMVRQYHPKLNLRWRRSIKLQRNWFSEVDARNRELLLGFGGEQQRIALGAAGIGGAGRFGLGDVLGEDRDHAHAAPVRCDHDLVGLVLGHSEFRLQDGDDKFAGREVVVDEDDLVQARPFGLGLNFGSRLGDGIDHSRWRLLERFHAKRIPVRVKKTRQTKDQSSVLIQSEPKRLWRWRAHRSVGAAFRWTLRHSLIAALRGRLDQLTGSRPILELGIL